ncbi:hypothetical protein ACFYUY_01065 [Kitasatospora sp. NPDC004745]|uniref:hypothetical protein n=1 Tax=unclassified Kitasatospora TaxID=2633591 RepID=UPI0033CB1B24
MATNTATKALCLASALAGAIASAIAFRNACAVAAPAKPSKPNTTPPPADICTLGQGDCNPS